MTDDDGLRLDAPGAAADVGLPWRFVVRENADRPTPEGRPQPAMTVHCPHCSTGYLLPDHLVGPRGVRVRCPSCQGTFVVLAGNGGTGDDASRETTPDDAFVRTPVESSGPAAGDEAPAATEAPVAVASDVLDALVARLGDDFVRARRTGRVLSAHGPAIMDAFDEYRRRAGGDAPPDPFCVALQRRCGIDLIPRRSA